MKIRTALALAALAVTPAFAAEPVTTRPATEETMTVTEKSAVDSLQKEIAMLQQTMEQIRKASAERAQLAKEQGERTSSYGLWP